MMRTVLFSLLFLAVAGGSYATLAANAVDADVDVVLPKILQGDLHTGPTNTGRLLLVGDVMLARDVERKMDAYGHTYPYQYIDGLFAAHRYVVANFEASVPEIHHPTPDHGFSFSVRSDILKTLINAGVTHVSLANNHSYDFGEAGMQHTVRSIDALGAEAFGDPYTLSDASLTYMTLENTRVALIGLDLTVSDYDADALRELFADARALSDQQFVFVHWGNEYTKTHSRAQEQWAEWFVAAGADLVVGHHPHVVQDIDRIEGVPVFYSLGNFIFDQYFSDEVMEGLALSLDLAQDRITLIPVTSKRTLIAPQVVSEEERTVYLQALARRSSDALHDEVKEGIISF